MFALENKKISVAGHKGMVGTTICCAVQKYDGVHLVNRSWADLDLLDPHQVADFFATIKPQVVFLPLLRWGGIVANMTYFADFMYQNLTITCVPFKCGKWYR